MFGGKPKSVDEAAARAVKGVRQVVRIDEAVAVVADHMGAAKKGLEAAAIQWDDGPNATVNSADIVRQLDEASKQPGAVARNEGDVEKALAGAAQRIDAIYQMPFLAHATMEPMNCTVHVRKDGCDIWVGTQAPTLTQAMVAELTGLPKEAVKVHNHLLGGGFGRRLEADGTRPRRQDRAAGGRAGQGRLEPRGRHPARHVPPLLLRPAVGGARCRRQAGGLDPPRLRLLDRCALYPAALQGRPRPRCGGGRGGAALCLAEHPCRLCAGRAAGIPTAFWRGVGPTHNVFVVESFMDELAHAAKQDPVAYRKALLGHNPRALGVLTLAAEKAGWGRPLPAGRGRGVSVQFAFGSYLAQVAEVEVAADGAVKVHRIVCAVDCGMVGQSGHDRGADGGRHDLRPDRCPARRDHAQGRRVEQGNFDTYLPMRIDEVPVVETHLVKSAEAPGGIGEAPTAVVAPAVTNAIFAATGKRIRTLPIDTDLLKFPS